MSREGWGAAAPPPRVGQNRAIWQVFGPKNCQIAWIFRAKLIQPPLKNRPVRLCLLGAVYGDYNSTPTK